MFKTVNSLDEIDDLGVASDGKGNDGINLVKVLYEPSAIQSNTSEHEVGHILGLDHFSKGIMMSSGSDKEVTNGMISKILKNAKIGRLQESESDKEVEKFSNNAWGNIKYVNDKKPPAFFRFGATRSNANDRENEQ